jgi:hypothetical protein
MQILYVGPLDYGGTCLQRLQAMKGLGYEIAQINTNTEHVQKKQKRLFYKVIRKIFGYFDLARANQNIILAAKEKDVDLLWIDKGLTIKAGTLKKIQLLRPKAIIAGYSPDDMGKRHNQSRQFINGLVYYNIYFTTKSYNVEELRELGCPKVIFVGNSYDPMTHRPMSITAKERQKFGGPVGFIGDYEQERAKMMLFLAKNGISVRVWGPNWERKCRSSHPLLKIEGRTLLGDDYAKAICSFDINLCFLRKINRDLQTTRSIEIPACGALMLAERTVEHLSLFKEGKEAAFFNSKEELLEKVQYYLSQKDERKAIAQAARERCLTSGYSNQDRIRWMLQHIGK